MDDTLFPFELFTEAVADSLVQLWQGAHYAVAKFGQKRLVFAAVKLLLLFGQGNREGHAPFQYLKDGLGGKGSEILPHDA
ncbi:MAG: hypothetical protein SPiTSB_32300 [Shewanella algae]|uniref:Uncharacterized protein n=1 Tax=Shewanella algae TaxID=38313 RepID=A0AAD1NKI6_9GAMM|nr:hypothetical protein TUM17379_00260 [Shewanella algae]BCV47333.1 hypothetical protein TUM17382_00260 [Shewanella algae]BCV51779.1 hypothetical protein TUM17383_00260 [Shewanella algae]